MVHNTKHWYLI